MSRTKIIKSKDSSTNAALTFSDILMPDLFLLCEDYVISTDNNLSTIKILDMLKPDELPFKPQRLVLIATFYRNPSVPPALFNELAPELQVILTNPSEAEFEVGIFPVSKLSETKPWLVERLILNLSGEIQFNSSGSYFLEVNGRVSSQPFQPTHIRLLPIAKPRNLKSINRKS